MSIRSDYSQIRNEILQNGTFGFMPVPMRINLLLQKGAVLKREQWVGAAEAVALRRGAELSFVGFYPPFVKNDLRRIARFGIDGMLVCWARNSYTKQSRSGNFVKWPDPSAFFRQAMSRNTNSEA